MKILAIVQARSGSQRLPKKIFAEIAGKPMLAHVVERVRLSKKIDEIVVATTVQQSDQPVWEICQHHNWPCFRGSESDVLDRYYQAASLHAGHIIVRITADCPLIDAEWIDRVIDRIGSADGTLDYASNLFPRRTLPRGLDVEALTISALRRLWLSCREPREREHVTLGLCENSKAYRVASVEHDQDLSNLRWTVDTGQDLQLVKRIFEQFPDNRFSWRQVLHQYKANPDWLDINREIQQKVA